ncbi:patatin-like phospholipase family protein [Muricoccus radiodurans]|uniref:patatin-like phospholipase family protein n=1 Tax=Muricoccus radiodurans TaxID=2231721 RepID=UPI003CE756E5
MNRLPRRITVALQGGGSLGAFSWGVLDRLLDVPGLEITAASGASAGALNAAMLVQGLAKGGPTEAQHALEILWRRVAVASGSLDFAGGDLLQAVLTPILRAVRRSGPEFTGISLNPLGLNPLRSILDGLLDPGAFGRPGAPMLVVAATRARTGEPRLFCDGEVTADVLLASACLPHLFPAVDIGGEPYWDGGYASNPPVRALIEAGAPSDVVIIRTTPTERSELPNGTAAVRERSTELAFGAALRQELRSIAHAQRLLSEHLEEELPPSSPLARLQSARLHMIGADTEFRALQAANSLDTSWSFLTRMRDLGQRTADDWLEQNLSSLGVASTLDLSGCELPLIARATGVGVLGEAADHRIPA